MISYSMAGSPNHPLGTVATYSCNAGFVLDLTGGSEMRTCVDDDDDDALGVFNGNAPACVRKYTTLADLEVLVEKIYEGKCRQSI